MALRDVFLSTVVAARGDEDEFDPFAAYPSDPDPVEAEGDDRINAPGVTEEAPGRPAAVPVQELE